MLHTGTLLRAEIYDDHSYPYTNVKAVYEAYIEEDPLNDGFVYTSMRVSDAQMTGDSGSNQTSFVLRTGLGFADYITLFYEDN